MIDKKLLENYEDAQMALLMDAYAKAEGEALMSEAEKVDEPFSETFKAKCMDLIDKEFAKRRRQKWMRNAVKKSVRAAVIAFAVVGFLSVGAMSVEGVRIPVVNFFLEQSEKFTTIIFGDKEPTDATTDVLEGTVQEGPLAGLLPDTYKLDSTIGFEDGSILVAYISDQNDYVTYSTKKWDGAKLSLDTEDTTNYEEKRLASYQAYIIIKDRVQIVWVNERAGLVYELVASNVEYDNLWSIAEKIASKK